MERPGAEGTLLLGRQALRRGRVEDALRWFETACRLDPSLAVAWFCRGVALIGQEKPEAAVSALQEAVRLEPSNAGHRYHLARAFALTGRPSMTVRALAPVVETDASIGDAAYEDEAFASLRDDPRFLALIGRLDA